MFLNIENEIDCIDSSMEEVSEEIDDKTKKKQVN